MRHFTEECCFLAMLEFFILEYRQQYTRVLNHWGCEGPEAMAFIAKNQDQLPYYRQLMAEHQPLLPQDILHHIDMFTARVLSGQQSVLVSLLQWYAELFILYKPIYTAIFSNETVLNCYQEKFQTLDALQLADAYFNLAMNLDQYIDGLLRQQVQLFYKTEVLETVTSLVIFKVINSVVNRFSDQYKRDTRFNTYLLENFNNDSFALIDVFQQYSILFIECLMDPDRRAELNQYGFSFENLAAYISANMAAKIIDNEDYPIRLLLHEFAIFQKSNLVTYSELLIAVDRDISNYRYTNNLPTIIRLKEYFTGLNFLIDSVLDTDTIKCRTELDALDVTLSSLLTQPIPGYSKFLILLRIRIHCEIYLLDRVPKGGDDLFSYQLQQQGIFAKFFRGDDVETALKILEIISSLLNYPYPLQDQHLDQSLNAILIKMQSGSRSGWLTKMIDDLVSYRALFAVTLNGRHPCP